ncbi:MAG: ComEC/Rec2 family competence protein [Phycisphaerales bacterium]|nr:ComEC/Rec2 family competence protein [Phycisphaerales bacterium]
MKRTPPVDDDRCWLPDTIQLSGAIVAALSFMAGLWLGHTLPWPGAVGWVVLAVVVSVVALIRPRRLGRFVLPVVIACAAAGWHDVRLERVDHSDIGFVVQHGQPRAAQLVGVIATEPTIGSTRQGAFARFAYLGPATRFTLRAERLVGRDGDEQHVTGRVWVRVDESCHGLHAGDRVMVLGMLIALEPPGNPGDEDFVRRARAAGASARLVAAARGNVTTIESASESWLGRASRRFASVRARVRAKASGWLLLGAFEQDEAYTNEARALVRALVLGERDYDLQTVSGAFRRVGLAHLLAISGLHLGILALVVAGAVRAVTTSRRAEAIVVVAVVLVYLFLVPARVPVVRASIMVLGFIAAESLGRRYDRLSVLALIALVLLIWRPLELWSPGFQLSFGIVAGLIALGGALRTRWFGERPDPDTLSPSQRVGDRLKTLIAGSVLAWALATPLVAHHFATICPTAALLSILSLPLAAVILISGYMKILTGALWPSIGIILGPILTMAAEMLAWLVLRVDRFPFSSIAAPPVSWRWTWFATAAVVYLAIHPRRHRLIAVGLIVIAAAWLFVGSAPPREWRLGRDVALRIDALHVGDGACMVLRSDGRTVIWDCGSASTLAVGDRIIVPAASELGVQTIDALIISHPNIDHYSGAIALARSYHVRQALVTEALLAEAETDPLGPLAYLLDELATLGVPCKAVSAGHTLTLGRAEMTWLHPAPGRIYDRINDGSMVVQIDVAGRTVLLTADVQREGMADLRSAHPDLTCDVLELPHHGSLNEQARAFVADLDPTIVLQSTGLTRDPAAWGDLAVSRTWYATAVGGAAWVEITEAGTIRSGCYRD